MNPILASIAATVKLSKRTLVSCYRVRDLLDKPPKPRDEIIEAILPLKKACGDLSDALSQCYYDETLQEHQFLKENKEYQGFVLETGQNALDTSIGILKELCKPLEAALRPEARDQVQWPFDPPAANVGKLETLKEQEKALRAVVSSIRGKMWREWESRTRTGKALSKTADVLRWYKTTDPERNHNTCQQSREPGTGTWVFGSPEFREWELAAGGELLWLHGTPGVGKTVLFSTMVDHIKSKLPSSLNSTSELPDRAAFYYFSFSDSSKQLVTSLLKSIIHQLLSADPEAEAEMAQDLYKTKIGVGIEVSIEELLKVCLNEISRTKRTYILIDALDETPESERCEFFLRCLDALRVSNVNILVTSRRKDDIKQKFSKLNHRAISLDAADVDEDVRAYVNNFLKYDPVLSEMSSEIHKEVSDGIVSKAGGMFRWAVCQLDIIRHSQTPEMVRKVLRDMPEGLDATYDRILGAVPPAYQKIVQSALWWLAFSVRPLLLEELSSAVAVVPKGDEPEAGPVTALTSQVILDVCGVLLTAVTQKPGSRWIREKTALETRGGQNFWPKRVATVISLGHYSVKEYLVSERLQRSAFSRYYSSEQLGNSFLTRCCLQYLMDFNGGKVISDLDFDKHPLLEYTSRNWTRHWALSRQEYGPRSPRHLFERLFGPEGRVAYTNWLNVWDPDNEFRDGVVSRQYSRRTKSADLFPQPLYWASLLGDIKLVSELIDQGADMLMYQGHFESALGAAVYRGHMKLVDLFLKNGMTPNAQGKRFGSVLQVAVASGSKVMVQRLLDAGADVNMQGGDRWDNALVAAAANRFQDLVDLLLKHGADPNVDTQQRESALYRAAKAGDFRLASTLIAAGADVNGSNSIFVHNPIHGAAWSGSLAIVELLISKGADVNKPVETDSKQYPLIMAIHKNHSEIVRVMLQAGADPNVRGRKGATALEECLFSSRDRAIFNMLIDKVADINACSDRNENCFEHAIQWGVYDLAKELLNRGAEIGSGVVVAATALYKKQPWILEAALERNLDVNTFGQTTSMSGTTALHAAIGNQLDLAILKRLLERGAYVNALDQHSKATPFAVAAKHGRVEAARLLMIHGADFHRTVNCSPMELAIQHACDKDGTLEMAEFLLASGYDINENTEEAPYWTMKHKTTQVLRWLVEKGLNLERRLRRPQTRRMPHYHPDSTPLQCAARLGDISTVQLLLDLGAQIDSIAGEDGTTLHYGLLSGNRSMVEFLLEKGAKIDDTIPRCSILCKAIKKGLESLVPTLIERGADINAVENVNSPLMTAYKAGNRELFHTLRRQGARFVEDDTGAARDVVEKGSLGDLKFLLQNGFDPNTKRVGCETVIDAAAKKADCSFIEMLVEAGGKINAEDHQDSFGDACEAGQIAMAEFLLSRTEDLDMSKALISAAKAPNNLNIIEMLFKQGADVSANDGKCFMSAAEADCQKTITRLLQQPMTPNERSNYLGQALQVAARNSNITLIEWLLDTQGANVNHSGPPFGSPLQAALSITHHEIGNQLLVFNMLIERGANVNPPIVKRPGPKPTHSKRKILGFLVDTSETFAPPLSLTLDSYSFERSLQQLTTELQSLGADVNGIGGQYHTPLQAAAFAYPEMLKPLLDAGADVNAAGGRFGTALHAAAWNKSIDAAKLLLARGADVRISAGDYGSVLQAAAKGGKAGKKCPLRTVEMMDLLLEAGADVHAQDGDYGSAVQMAAATDNVAALKWLADHGANIRVKGGKHGNAYKAAMRHMTSKKGVKVQWSALSWLEQHYGREGWE